MSERMVKCTMREWFESAQLHIASGATAVEITDREPEHADDFLTPRGAWGWRYGYLWLDEYMPGCIPEWIFVRLPPSHYKTVQDVRNEGGGAMPRWQFPWDAKAALNLAAFEWAANGD
jgi:hypothetical protein